jgi:hypothetical protein
MMVRATNTDRIGAPFNDCTAAPSGRASASSTDTIIPRGESSTDAGRVRRGCGQMNARGRRRRVLRFNRLELQPIVARLMRNYEATLGRPPTADELADFRAAAVVLHVIGTIEERMTGEG